MLRGFGVLGHAHTTIENPRGYLIRIATNLWTDGIPRRASENHTLKLAGDEASSAIAATPETDAVRGAASRLMQMLAPLERAALALKEVLICDLRRPRKRSKPQLVR